MKLLNKFKYELLIAFIFVLTRFPDLGHDMFNTDVWKWKTRSYDFSTGIFNLQFDQTIQKYHPGVTLMWLGTLGIKIFNLYNETTLKVSPDSVQAIFGLHFVQKLMVVISIGLTLSSIFYVLNKLFGKKYALLSVFLISFEPFYIALTRAFHLEGLQSTFMLAAIVWFYYWYINLENKNFISKNSLKLFSACFFSALAFLTKTTALYLIPFFGLWILINTFKTKKIKNGIFNFLQWLLPSLGFVFLLWPALWVIPLQVFNILYQGVVVVGVETEHIQYFFGKLVEDPGWYFYFVVFLFRSSYWLIIGFMGTLLTFITSYYSQKSQNKFSKTLKNIFSPEQTNFIVYNLYYILFYFIMLSIPSKKLDRYVLPLMISSVLIASFFINYYFDKIKTNFKYILLVLPIFTAYYLHPNYFSYYSVGLKFGIYAIEPKWMIGQKEIVSYFKNLKSTENYSDSYDMSFEEVIQDPQLYPKTLSVGFPEKYYTQIWPFFREFGAWAVIQDLRPFAVKTNYFIYPVWNDESENENRFKLKYIDTIKVRGVNVYNVYQRVQ